MITYCCKAIICSGILLLAYYLFLQREKMHRFNRFYLLCALAASFAVPVITIPVAIPQPDVNNSFVYHGLLPNIVPSNANIVQAAFPYMEVSLGAVYIIIAALLAARYCRNIARLKRIIKVSEVVVYNNAQLVLVNAQVAPFSFLRYIFVSRHEYENGLLEDEVFTHELAHITQRHTIDIIFIEALHAVFWFNPFILLYKKAIQVNHEFLADEAVITACNSITSYQTLLLAKAAQNTHTMFASSFNYLTIKKRLTMMTKNTPLLKEAFLKCTCFLFAAATVFFMSVEVRAQSGKAAPSKQAGTSPAQTQELVVNEGITQAEFDEYDNAFKGATKTVTLKNGEKRAFLNYGLLNVDRLNYLYYAMSKEQRAKSTKVFGMPVNEPPAKEKPTAEQLQKWQDGKLYGVWLDGKRLKNSELANYKPGDFVHYWASRLMPNAVKNDGFNVQIELLTGAYYNEAYALNIKYAKYAQQLGGR